MRFHDWVPRERLLPEIARAGALVHPSLHDDAPLSVAEALSLGTPVICLDHGSPQRETILLLSSIADDDEQDRELRAAAGKISERLRKKGAARR